MSDTRRALLSALADGPVSGPELADRLDISRAAVWKHVESLRDEGFVVESESDGYVVTEVPEYGGPAIEYGLEADYDVAFHDVLGSTNDTARELASEGESDVVVVAREQSASKGRKERAWTAPDGGVWMSVLIRPDEPPAFAPLYTLAMAVAVCDAAREAGVDASIKWPNDVIVSRPSKRATSDGSSDSVESDGVIVSESSDDSPDTDASDHDYRKLCGILTEMEGEADRVSWLVIGPGINVNIAPEELPEEATSVSAEASPVERRIFVQRVLERFDELRADLDSVLPAWRERADTLGRRVRVHTANGVVEGEAIGIEHPGTLVVRTDDGETRVHAGDCEHLRPVAET
ncbi:biotin--[acetyl-CoA-carboxylase] ligase [Haloferax larsenii]|uniref:BirA family transcriptional regulator, biotin operon repressor / biotin-[acetyl-CoA-carboxylase] ligase n=1 Tax=Haloferax larsenii TaxID=302484 RepID=A0A1H7QKL0_HALLR|nr:biotin--[acetyl-CoA-carboxylase] ligase [Haloferax larsenii]SEL47797.1 BirA family transcriptional regulator, biotin operon repressor / biotin-[acetyl-CoA-carboxylase] ligase [Haloferax larsenii]